MSGPRRHRGASAAERARRRGAGAAGGSERGERLQRVLADAGIAARRACERMIEDGRVAVNGRIVRRLPVFVVPGDRVTVNGLPIRRRGRPVYVMLNKPERVLTASADEPGAGRRTVSDLVRHPSGARLFPVGRLEYSATGLVLMTNDGDLAARLTHPRFGVPKVYRAVVKGGLKESSLPGLEREAFRSRRRAIRLSGRLHAPRAALSIEDSSAERTVLSVTLAEGRLPDLARVLASAGHPVRHLEQVGLGPLRLAGVARGRWRELDRAEVQSLRRLVRSNGKPVAPGDRSADAPEEGGR